MLAIAFIMANVAYSVHFALGWHKLILLFFLTVFWFPGFWCWSDPYFLTYLVLLLFTIMSGVL